MTKILVTGGRDYTDEKFIFETLDRLHRKHNFTCLIHGDAQGVDKISERWAINNDVPVESHPANWELHGKSAGPIRNSEMLKSNPTMLIAFPGGKGTADMVKKAQKHDSLELIYQIKRKV